MGFPSPATRVIKVPSLLFELELDDERSLLKEDGSKEECEALRQVRRCTKHRALGFVQQLEKDVQHLYQLGLSDPVELAEALIRKGYTVQVKRTLGSVASLRCLHTLRHTFLLCSYEGHRRSLIVDPSFREQFEVAKATAEYDSIVAELPQPFVGTEEEVELLVHLLCGELQHSFKEQGTHMPPWRSAASMMSKWKPQNCIDVPLLHVGRASDPMTSFQGDAAAGAGSKSVLDGGAVDSGTAGHLANDKRRPTVHSWEAASERDRLLAVRAQQHGSHCCSLPRIQLFGFLPTQGCNVLPS